MKVVVLTCTLKKEKKDGSYVFGTRRLHKTDFEIVNPTQGDIVNLKGLCDIKESKREIPDEDVVTVGAAVSDVEIPKEDNSELIEFANDCWTLAVKYEKEIKKLTESAPAATKPAKARKKKA